MHRISWIYSAYSLQIHNLCRGNRTKRVLNGQQFWSIISVPLLLLHHVHCTKLWLIINSQMNNNETFPVVWLFLERSTSDQTVYVLTMSLYLLFRLSMDGFCSVSRLLNTPSTIWLYHLRIICIPQLYSFYLFVNKHINYNNSKVPCVATYGHLYR